MNILIRLPNWLGDAIMASYALELLYQSYPNAKFYLVGSQVACELYKNLKNTTVLQDRSKQAKCRIYSLFKLARSIPPCDLSFSFQNNFLSALFLRFNNAKVRVGYKNEMRSFLLTHSFKKEKSLHEVLVFATLIKPFATIQLTPKLYLKKPKISLPLLQDANKIAGINPGAAFGSAKRWSEENFAKVAIYLHQQGYKILLFGGINEIEITKRILALLDFKEEVLNLCGKTDIQTLLAYFAKLDLLVTNDSGPMHIGAAFNIPMVAIFGPTNDSETSPFGSKNAHIISLKTLGNPLSCMPCKKRTCPIPKHDKSHHQCMQALKPEFVISKIQSLISDF
ncbi:lipopolysaccharide heptosyltransferase II [Helicobacter valdiviensis]|uniref:lipopolysaccharide heptosyltransferase II n=1 Tax=Helicobacter valdiviensis TaxID=1458358 RepID=A0A2W6MY97_9HELI|nr:lipopolysaccharide heptosyltransferase II [Helicobacter valdiviensis]PZT48288.1 lipopolysaccharide heptosyltransferase II [Helicobacter valdiviensis]